MRVQACLFVLCLSQGMAFSFSPLSSRLKVYSRSCALGSGARPEQMIMRSTNRADFGAICARWAAATVGTALVHIPAPAEATTPSHVVNSVLSAYGIPMMDEKAEFTSVYVQVPTNTPERTVCAFSYPKFWVEGKRRDGLVNAANYQTGDAVTLAMASAPEKASSIKGVSAVDIAAAATPSGGSVEVLNESPVTQGGVNYKYLTLKYNVLTRSGYDKEQLAYVAAALWNRKLYTLAATAPSEREKNVGQDLNAIRDSFRVGEGGSMDEGLTKAGERNV